MKTELYLLQKPEKVPVLQKFFKTRKGEYAEGDIFIGITVPEIRKIANKYYKISSFDEVKNLLHSKIHEERALALFLLVLKFEKLKLYQEVVDFYINPKNLQFVNHWDLVDLSSYKILGNFCLQNNKNLEILYNFAKNGNLWQKRISIVSTLVFIKKGEFKDAVNIIKLLFQETHPILHKAMGWMLREIGKKDKTYLVTFLKEYSKNLAKISFSYATEKLSKEEKLEILMI